MSVNPVLISAMLILANQNREQVVQENKLPKIVFSKSLNQKTINRFNKSTTKNNNKRYDRLKGSKDTKYL